VLSYVRDVIETSIGVFVLGRGKYGAIFFNGEGKRFILNGDISKYNSLSSVLVKGDNVYFIDKEKDCLFSVSVEDFKAKISPID